MFIIDEHINLSQLRRNMQVKKSEVRDAILGSAFMLFSEQGYAQTTQAQIARRAGLAASSLYVYFDSKLDILFAVYRPWLMQRFDELEGRMAKSPRRGNAWKPSSTQSGAIFRAKTTDSLTT